VSLRQVHQMIAASRKAGVKAGVVLQCRTRKSIQAMRKAIGEGRFGRLLHADMYMKWFRPAEYYRLAEWRGRGGFTAGWHPSFPPARS